MKRNKRLLRQIALLLLLVLLLSAAAAVLAAQPEETTEPEAQTQDAAAPEEAGENTAAEEPEKTVIHIASADDLLELAKNCALDSWSQGVIAELDVDLSLEGIEFPMIPSFGGIFRGNGRTISGLNLTGDTSTAGLFRSIQAGGRVENLNVIGTLSPESACEAVGGIAGVNAGTISGCSFSGSVSGSANVGGIAGKNTQTGAIYSCRADGAIYGERMTGGIAGCNLGTVSDCVNAAYVNTVNSDETLSLEDLAIDTTFDLDRLKGSQADVPSSNTDTGGIAGYSSGRVSGCSNTSTVGYSHVGYNVGGIIGRSCGYVEGCENSGAVYGRKDVGGIIGQMEPYIRMEMSESSLELLEQQLAELNALVEQAISDAEGGADGVSAQLGAMSGYVDRAAQEAENVRVIVDADGSVIGSGSSGVSGGVTVTPPSAVIGGGSSSEGGADIRVKPGSIEIGSIIDSGAAAGVIGIPGGASGGVGSSGSGSIDANGQIVATPELGDLTSAVNGISAQINGINAALAGTSGRLADDMRAIHEKYDQIAATLSDAAEAAENPEDVVTDASDVDVDAITLGKVTESTNRGAVNGDINVGGIAGTMAPEYALDPEDDLSEGMSADTRREYELKAVIQNCTAYGAVTAKRSYAGGVCGRMELGLILGSCGFADTKSESGSYVGGIAGLTAGTVWNCFVKCTLQGESYLGGVVGSGVSESVNQTVSTVSGCYSMVEIPSSGSYIGAISGAYAGAYQENYFVSDTLCGIDGQSCAGKAEPIDYDALLEVPELPEDMKQLVLRFTDGDGSVLKAVTFSYGDSFDESIYPELPQKDDCYTYWDKTELEELRFDTTVQAVSVPYVTTLTASSRRDSGRPVFYAEGEYDEDAALTVTSQPKSTAGFSPLSSGLREALQHYTEENPWYKWIVTPLNREVIEQWHISAADDGQQTHILHYLSPDETAEKLTIYVRQDGGAWEKTDSEAFGSYLTFELTGCSADLAIVSVVQIWWVWAGVLVLLAALIVGIILLCTRPRSRRLRLAPAQDSTVQNDKDTALPERTVQNAETDASGRPKKNPKRRKKKWLLPVVLALALLAALGAFLISKFAGPLTVYQALSELDEQETLSMELSLRFSAGGTDTNVQTRMDRKTVDAKRITRVTLSDVPLYYAGQTLILENGTAYRIGSLFPDYPALLTQIVPLYQNATIQKTSDGEDQITVTGQTAQTLLCTVLPDLDGLISDTQQLTIRVTLADDTVQTIALSASGVLADDAQTEFSFSLLADSIREESDMEVPQAVADTARAGAWEDLPIITEDVLRLLSAWAELDVSDAFAADVSVSASCGIVSLRDALTFYTMRAEEKKVHCLRRDGLELYWSDGDPVDENGDPVSAEDAKKIQLEKLLDLANTVCQTGQFSRSVYENTYVYTLQLDEDAMERAACMIAPDIRRQDAAFTSGTLTLQIRNGSITALSFSCTGTAGLPTGDVTATVSAQFTITDRQTSIPEKALHRL